jgi:hypothetical protein
MRKYQIAVMDIAERYKFEYPYVIPLKSLNGRLKQPYIPCCINDRGYPCISYRNRPLDIDMKIEIHRVIGFQKFGDKIFEKNLVCRHLNNNKLDFSLDNIQIGTVLDNCNDNSAIIREKINLQCKENGRNKRKLSDKEVLELKEKHNQGQSYSSLAKTYKISKSTVFYIIKNQTYAK